MINIAKGFSRTTLVLATAAWLILSSSMGWGQDGKLAYPADPANVPDAVAKVKSGNFTGADLEMIAKFHAVEAIPDLRQQFKRSQDGDTKDQIASVLVRLGETGDAYWDYLVDYATKALDSNPPDIAGKENSREPPPRVVGQVTP